MASYRVEAILASVFLVLFSALCLKLAPEAPLSAAEISVYVDRLNKGLRMPEPDRSEFIKRLRAWGEDDDGKPIYLMNLIRYKEKPTAWPGESIKVESVRAAHDVYLKVVIPMVLERGTYPVFGSDMQGMNTGRPERSNLAGFNAVLDGWSEININRYRSRRALLDLLSDPRYLDVMPYKFAAMELVSAPVSPRLMLPDPRLLCGTLFLIIFLLTAWIRSIRRCRPVPQ